MLIGLILEGIDRYKASRILKEETYIDENDYNYEPDELNEEKAYYNQNNSETPSNNVNPNPS